MRLYRPDLGRFVSVDPISAQYPMLTPYQFASNTPIQAIDLDGLEALIMNDGVLFGDHPNVITANNSSVLGVVSAEITTTLALCSGSISIEAKYDIISIIHETYDLGNRLGSPKNLVFEPVSSISDLTTFIFKVVPGLEGWPNFDIHVPDAIFDKIRQDQSMISFLIIAYSHECLHIYQRLSGMDNHDEREFLANSFSLMPNNTLTTLNGCWTDIYQSDPSVISEYSFDPNVLLRYEKMTKEHTGMGPIPLPNVLDFPDVTQDPTFDAAVNGWISTALRHYNNLTHETQEKYKELHQRVLQLKDERVKAGRFKEAQD